jgi:hypothetical protein
MGTKMISVFIIGGSLFGFVACAPVSAPTSGATAMPEQSQTVTAETTPATAATTVEEEVEPATVSTPEAQEEVQPDTPQETTMPEEPTPDTAVQPQAGDPQAVVTALAVQDLSQRLGIPSDQIKVTDVRAVTWPDSSLGCPQPDMMYAQMQQDGYLISLNVAGAPYFYHSGPDQAPFLCEDTLQLAPQPKEDEMVPPPGFKLDQPDSSSD